MNHPQRIEAHDADGAHGTWPALPTSPVLSSASRQWPGIVFERHRVESGQLPQHTLAPHCFLLPVGPEPVAYQCTLDGRRVAGQMVPGKVQFRAAGSTVSTEWHAPLEGIFVALDPQALANGAGADGGQRHMELRSDLTPQDNPVLTHLTLALDAHLRSPALLGRLFEESLLNAICANVLARYGGPTAAPAGTLAISRQALRRVHDFVHTHLHTEFGIKDIAQAACVSPYHLSRVYRQSTGQSLWQYVLQCRAQRARELIDRHPRLALAQVALLTGFDSYGQFIGAFRKAHGIKPGQYQKTLR